MLMVDGVDKIGAHLRAIMEKARSLDEIILFIDEFEEFAGSRDSANRIDRSITNEFLKQVPLIKSQPNKVLLVCATNTSANWMLHCYGRGALIALSR